MYDDPAHIRKHQVKILLSDYEAALLNALCKFRGEQKGTAVREIVVQEAIEVLHGSDCADALLALRGRKK